MPNIRVDDPVYSILTRKKVELSTLHGIEATYNMAIKFYINKFRENKNVITKNEETNEWIRKLLEQSIKSSRTLLSPINIPVNDYSKHPTPPIKKKKLFNPNSLTNGEKKLRNGIKKEITELLASDPKHKGLSSRKITKEDVIEEFNHWKEYYKREDKLKLKPVKVKEMLRKYPFLSEGA